MPIQYHTAKVHRLSILVATASRTFNYGFPQIFCEMFNRL